MRIVFWKNGGTFIKRIGFYHFKHEHRDRFWCLMLDLPLGALLPYHFWNHFGLMKSHVHVPLIQCHSRIQKRARIPWEKNGIIQKFEFRDLPFLDSTVTNSICTSLSSFAIPEELEGTNVVGTFQYDIIVSRLLYPHRHCP